MEHFEMCISKLIKKLISRKPARRAGSDGSMLPLDQQVRGSIPGEVVIFHLKIFNLGARRGGDVNFLVVRLYITGLD